MQILITDINQIFQPLTAPVLTIGNFDGIHLGHQSLFQKVRERAKAIKGTPMVITFQSPSGPDLKTRQIPQTNRLR